MKKRYVMLCTFLCISTLAGCGKNKENVAAKDSTNETQTTVTQEQLENSTTSTTNSNDDSKSKSSNANKSSSYLAHEYDETPAVNNGFEGNYVSQDDDGTLQGATKELTINEDGTYTIYYESKSLNEGDYPCVTYFNAENEAQIGPYYQANVIWESGIISLEYGEPIFHSVDRYDPQTIINEKGELEILCKSKDDQKVSSRGTSDQRSEVDNGNLVSVSNVTFKKVDTVNNNSSQSANEIAQKQKIFSGDINSINDLFQLAVLSSYQYQYSQLTYFTPEKAKQVEVIDPKQIPKGYTKDNEQVTAKFAIKYMQADQSSVYVISDGKKVFAARLEEGQTDDAKWSEVEI